MRGFLPWHQEYECANNWNIWANCTLATVSLCTLRSLLFRSTILLILRSCHISISTQTLTNALPRLTQQERISISCESPQNCLLLALQHLSGLNVCEDVFFGQFNVHFCHNRSVKRYFYFVLGFFFAERSRWRSRNCTIEKLWNSRDELRGSTTMKTATSFLIRCDYYYFELPKGSENLRKALAKIVNPKKSFRKIRRHQKNL